MDDKPPLSELTHYGIKGMRWGVRRAEPTNPKYTPDLRTRDRKRHGSRAVNRINRRMNKGESRTKALQKEELRDQKQRLIAAGAVFAARLVVVNAAVRIGTPNTHSTVRTPPRKTNPAKPNFVKPKRGVYNITTMK